MITVMEGRNPPEGMDTANMRHCKEQTITTPVAAARCTAVQPFVHLEEGG